MSAPTVLIIEDELILQDVYSLILGTNGYDVVLAGNGAEGIIQLRKTRPNIVLLDVLMPVMDGKEFLRNFDATEFPHTKVIAYTNLSDHETQTEMIQLGAIQCILKSSMTPQDLLDLLDKVLKAS